MMKQFFTVAKYVIIPSLFMGIATFAYSAPCRDILEPPITLGRHIAVIAVCILDWLIFLVQFWYDIEEELLKLSTDTDTFPTCYYIGVCKECPYQCVKKDKAK